MNYSSKNCKKSISKNNKIILAKMIEKTLLKNSNSLKKNKNLKNLTKKKKKKNKGQLNLSHYLESRDIFKT